jgi:biotin carboxylase
VATRLGELGHHVEILSSTSLCLARFTRHVRGVHRVPPFGREPLRWLDAAVEIARGFDVLLPTQEQVTVLSAFTTRLPIPTIVPPFEALRAVQDKVSAYRALAEWGVPQPETHVVSSASSLGAIRRFPVFLKRAVSTASSGVRRADDPAQLRRAFDDLATGGAELLVQEAACGPLAMVQAIADHGRMLAVHANVRTREGVSGGACVKESVFDRRIESCIEPLLAGLAWHGPISFDAILTSAGPLFIDVNPRLVEPRNAQLSGVDFVDLALSLALGVHPPASRPSRAGVRTHQLLLAELGAARRGRAAVAREVLEALSHRGSFEGSVEELTPIAGDLRAIVPTAVVGALLLAHPPSWRRVSSTSVDAYALSPDGWSAILERHSESKGRRADADQRS